jgi:hypothetical protein
MNIPRVIREQVKEYSKAGFHVIDYEPRSGAHFKVWFAEFDEPQIITKNLMGWRSIKNNIAHYRRLAAKKDRDETDND